MKSKLKKRLTYFVGALLLGMLMVVNIQVASSTENNIGDLNLLGLQSTIFTPAAMATGGNLRCNDITNCKTKRGCGTSGTVNGCSLYCDDGESTPITCPYDWN